MKKHEKKYIEVEGIMRACYDSFLKTGNKAYSEIIALTDAVPAADVVEVRHGHWETIDKGHFFYDWKCSNCGASGRADYLFCPNCGASMDAEDQPKRFWPEQIEKLMMETIAKAVTKGNKDECVVGCDGYCEECPMGEENK